MLHLFAVSVSMFRDMDFQPCENHPHSRRGMEKARERLLAFQAWDSWTSNFSAHSLGDSTEIRRISQSTASSEGEVELSPATTPRFPKKKEIQAPVSPKTPSIPFQVKDKSPKVNSRNSPHNRQTNTLSAIEYITRDLDNDSLSAKYWNNCHVVESDSETESVAFLHLSELRSDTDESLPLSHVSPPIPPHILETEKSATPYQKSSIKIKEEANMEKDENTKKKDKPATITKTLKINPVYEPILKKGMENSWKEKPRRYSKSEWSDFKRCSFASSPKGGPEKFLEQLAKKGIRVKRLGETCTLINVVQSGEISGSENEDQGKSKILNLSQIKPMGKTLNPRADRKLVSTLADQLDKQKNKSDTSESVEVAKEKDKPSNHFGYSGEGTPNCESSKMTRLVKGEIPFKIELREHKPSTSLPFEMELEESELCPKKESKHSKIEPRRSDSKIRARKLTKAKQRSGTPHKTYHLTKKPVRRGDIKLKRHIKRLYSATDCQVDGEFEDKKGKCKRGISKGKKKWTKEHELCKERGDESEKTFTKHGNHDCVVRKQHDFPRRCVRKRKRSKSIKSRKCPSKLLHTADKSTQTDQFYCILGHRPKKTSNRRVCYCPMNLPYCYRNNNATIDFETRGICRERVRKRKSQKISYRGDNFIGTNLLKRTKSPEPTDDCNRVKQNPHHSSRLLARGDQTDSRSSWLTSLPKGTWSCKRQMPVESTPYMPKLHSRLRQKLPKSKIFPNARCGSSFKEQIQENYKKRNPCKIKQIIAGLNAKYAFNIRDYANYFRALRNENSQDWEKAPRTEYSRWGEWTHPDSFEFEEFVCFIIINSADIDDTVIPFRVSIARHKILARIFNLLKEIQGTYDELHRKIVRAGNYVFDMRSLQIWSEIGTLPFNHPVRKMLRNSEGPQDRRIFAIENEIAGRILLAEDKVVFVKGYPCFQVHIFAPSTKAISFALMRIQQRLPTLYSKLIMTERLPKVHGGRGDKTTPAPTTANFTVKFGSPPRLAPRVTMIHVPMTAKPKDRRDYVSYCGALWNCEDPG